MRMCGGGGGTWDLGEALVEGVDERDGGSVRDIDDIRGCSHHGAVSTVQVDDVFVCVSSVDGIEPPVLGVCGEPWAWDAT